MSGNQQVLVHGCRQATCCSLALRSEDSASRLNLPLYIPHYLLKIGRWASQVDRALAWGAVAALLAFQQFNVKVHRLAFLHTQQIKWNRYFNNAVDADFDAGRAGGSDFALVQQAHMLARGSGRLDQHVPAGRIDEADAQRLKAWQRCLGRAVEIHADEQRLEAEAEVHVLDRPARDHGHGAALVLASVTAGADPLEERF